MVLRGCVGLLLLPLTVRAEWGSNDSTNLYLITGKTGDIKTDTQYIRQYTEWVYDSLGYSHGSSGFRLRDDLQSILKLLRTVDNNSSSSATDLTTIASKTTKIAENSDSVVTKLDEIIAALEALAESGGSSGGGSGSGTEITQDWLKETTFTTAYNEEKAATQEYRDWFKSAFGFGGSSSSPSFASYLGFGGGLDTYSVVAPSVFGNEASPFPTVEEKWQNASSSNNASTPNFAKRSLPIYFSYVLSMNLSKQANVFASNMKKQAWNDYYAHTNLVANLWAIHNTAPTGESPTIGFADGVLTYKDGSSASGSSAPTTQTLDLNPVATNAYDSVVGDITTLTESVSSGTSTGDNPIDTDAIRARYFAYLDIQGASTDIGDDIRAASSSGETLKINFMGGSAELDLAAWGTSYRSIMTQERLRTWRGAMGIIWMLAAWCGGFYLVKRLGNME